MTSGLSSFPTRRAHSNHAEVARSIGVDIIAGRYAEGGRLPRRCRTHGDVRRIAAGVARERQNPGGERAAHHQGAGRHRGARARRLEHVRRRRAGLASRWRYRPAFSQRSRRDTPGREPRAAALAARPPLGSRHRRTPPEHGANAGGAFRLRRFCRRRSCPAPGRRQRLRQFVHALDRQRYRGGIAGLVPAQRAGRNAGSSRRCCCGTSASSMRSRAAMPRPPPQP